MNEYKANLPGVVVFKPDVFSDKRGYFKEILTVIGMRPVVYGKILFKIIFPLQEEVCYVAFIFRKLGHKVS